MPVVVLEPPVVLEPVVLLIINLSDVWIDIYTVKAISYGVTTATGGLRASISWHRLLNCRPKLGRT